MESLFPTDIQGPCGEEWDDEYDGLSESEPINGNPRADGISLACQDSIVERNVSCFALYHLSLWQIVTDATDGGIVLFGSAGSEVRENHVYSRARVNLGGALSECLLRHLFMIRYQPSRLRPVEGRLSRHDGAPQYHTRTSRIPACRHSCRTRFMVGRHGLCRPFWFCHRQPARRYSIWIRNCGVLSRPVYSLAKLDRR